jgi:8-oxo-dGTP diphosphatase
VGRTYRHARASTAVDIVVLTIRNERLQMLAIRRGVEPYRGAWALPGGFVRVEGGRGGRGESLAAAARRELREETGLDVDEVWLRQLHAFGDPARDPRGRVISIAYLAIVSPELVPRVAAATDADEAAWFLAHDPPRLAFDHAEILEFALHYLGDTLPRSPSLAYHLVAREFTIGELRRVHEIIENRRFDQANFRRAFLRLVERGEIQQVEGSRASGGRPAAVYRLT